MDCTSFSSSNTTEITPLTMLLAICQAHVRASITKRHRSIRGVTWIILHFALPSISCPPLYMDIQMKRTQYLVPQYNLDDIILQCSNYTSVIDNHIGRVSNSNRASSIRRKISKNDALDGLNTTRVLRKARSPFMYSLTLL